MLPTLQLYILYLKSLKSNMWMTLKSKGLRLMWMQLVGKVQVTQPLLFFCFCTFTNKKCSGGEREGSFPKESRCQFYSSCCAAVANR